jgi:hypothetical protein
VTRIKQKWTLTNKRIKRNKKINKDRDREEQIKERQENWLWFLHVKTVTSFGCSSIGKGKGSPFLGY